MRMFLTGQKGWIKPFLWPVIAVLQQVHWFLLWLLFSLNLKGLRIVLTHVTWSSRNYQMETGIGKGKKRLCSNSLFPSQAGMYWNWWEEPATWQFNQIWISPGWWQQVTAYPLTKAALSGMAPGRNNTESQLFSLESQAVLQWRGPAPPMWIAGLGRRSRRMLMSGVARRARNFILLFCVETAEIMPLLSPWAGFPVPRELC